MQHVQQVRQIKAEEMRYRSLIDKVDDGKALTDEEVKTLQEYEQKYPEGDLKDRIQGALGENARNKKVAAIKKEQADAKKAIDKVKQDVKNEKDKKSAIEDFLERNFPGLDEEVRNNLIGEIIDGVDNQLANNPTVVKNLEKAGLTWELVKQLKAYSLGLESPNIGIGSNMVTTNTEVVQTKNGPTLQNTSSTLFGDVGSAGLTSVLTAIDFQTQIDNGADVEDATLKTAGHFAIGMGAGKLGAAIGTALFPGPGSVAGFVSGFVIGTIVSVVTNNAFDDVYDKNIEPVVEDAKNYLLDDKKESTGSKSYLNNMGLGQ
ncbi:hypothetical protein DHL47_13025 [Streptococcus panodentis]|uniref:Uncharacterized protein n=1 Tax=Streptococcus panodentis TaxID=1581472 RepID=A0ABS5B053_9STRE|nr:hypothetical protein [Streptococcus panodentis]